MQQIRFLLIHGFGGNTGEVAPLADYLITKGYTCSCPALKGHTGRRKDIKMTTYHDWLASAEEALIALTKDTGPVIVIGFSMGGLIALNLALKYPIDALVTINTPIYYWELKQVALNLVNDFRTGEYRHLKHYLRSSRLPLTSMRHFWTLLTQTKPLVDRITQPILVLQGTDDDTVRPKSANYIYDHVQSAVKQIAFLDHSGHAMLHSPAAVPAMERIMQFIGEVETQR